MKSGRLRCANVSSPLLATEEWISTLYSTECLRAFRSPSAIPDRPRLRLVSRPPKAHLISAENKRKD